MKKAIVIGSGIGGIATALRLKSMNYDVTVFENNNFPGGKLTSFDLGPYRFDAGPSLLTMPHFIDELFVLFNENPRDHFNYKKKEISCKYFWDDGVKLNAYSEKSKFINEINRFATYNGSSPYKTPGMMTLVQHLEQEYGTYVSDKGMNNITKSLYDLATRQGVKFKFESYVSKILVNNKKAVGVMVGEKSYNSEIVVSNMDIVPTYRNLLKNHYQPEKTLNQERSSSALIFYWGIKKEFKNLDLHNIFFSTDYKKEFQSIFEDNTISSDPTVYVNITSKDVKGDAPDNCENWFVMINSPNDSGQDWDSMIDDVKSTILKKINKLLKINLEDFIEHEKVYTPKTIQANTQSHMGSLYGSSSNNLMSAFLRHPNFSNEILNLYFCGGSVHPGGGIPLCLLSAKIVSQLIKNK